MSSPEAVIEVLRAQMRRASVTYKMLAERIGMSESSIKRIFSQKDMALSRLAGICKAAGLSMEDVLREAADRTPHIEVLTAAQEKSLVTDPHLLLVAICCLGNWSVEQIVETYALNLAQCVRALARLDRLGVIVLKPNNSYRLQVSPAFHWYPNGPVQRYFREHVVADYFSGSFAGEGELVLCVPARLTPQSASDMAQKIKQLAQEMARLQQQDQRYNAAKCDGYTLLVGLRSWELSAFSSLRRVPGSSLPDHQTGPRKR